MELVSERYRLDAELGAGGTATVWLAHDQVLDRSCAVKLLLPDRADGGAARADRLRAEGRTLAALDHPHVVRVLDQGEHDGQVFVVMEHIEGGSLADLLHREGPVRPDRAVGWMLQILDALTAAHRAGIVHRDVKPGNVLLRSDDEVALCDFGIARFELQGSGTRTGMALGSVGFMAPEQRVDARSAGPAADLYGLSCTLFNLVTDDTPVDLYLAPDTSPRWEDVPPPLRGVLRRGTQTDPRNRYHNTEEMAEALRGVLPALEGFERAQRRGSDTVPLDAEPAAVAPALTLTAQHRKRKVAPEDWAWSSRRNKPGRMALWVGVSLVVAITGVGLASGPLVDRVQTAVAPTPSAPEARPASPPPTLAGHWVGNVAGDRPMSMALSGSLHALTGHVEVVLGTHTLRGPVSGSFDEQAGVLSLHEAGAATYRAERGAAPGMLVGEMVRTDGGEALPFALVWVGSQR